MFGNRRRELGCPFAPMRGTQLNGSLAFRLDPSAQNTPAGKSNRADTGGVDNCKLQIAIEWRSGYPVPHGVISRLREATVRRCADV